MFFDYFNCESEICGYDYLWWTYICSVFLRKVIEVDSLDLVIFKCILIGFEVFIFRFFIKLKCSFLILGFFFIFMMEEDVVENI